MKNNDTNAPYGYVTGLGEDGVKHSMPILDFLRAEFADHRLVSSAGLDGDEPNVVTVVENPASSGRATQSTIRLSHKSFSAVLAVAVLYFQAKGQDLVEMGRQAIKGQVLDFDFSTNLQNPFPEDAEKS